MTPAEIKRKRTESILKEILPDALSSLQDSRIKYLNVTDVICSRGRYDAKVYLDVSGIDELEQKEALKQLRKVSHYLKDYVKDSQGWYRAPNFVFEFDTQLEDFKRIDNLFEQIKKER